ncbi:MAG TPA: ATP-dependent Clp protease ATP-binding subunit [Candidatus Saccharimonadales bacterium]|nr:ATP-dependent Clp protease ATP-binding subunit [Candidatus Saccharimonadales bacterium]
MNGVNLASQRATQARLGIILGKPGLRALLIALSFTCIGLGFWLLWLQAPVGWLALLCGVWPLIPIIWYTWWLKEVPVGKGQAVDDLLESPLLGTLQPNMSPAQLAELTMRQPGGVFFAVRFGVAPTFLAQMSSQNNADTEVIWQTALQLQHDLKLPFISTPVVVAALIRAMPGRDQLLAQLQLSFEDVISGVGWYHHVEARIAESKAARNSGGIGRDLSFGYTPLLGHFAQNISLLATRANLARELEGHQEILRSLMQQLARGGKQNAVLVGPPGAGKTTIVHALAERLLLDGLGVPHELQYRQIMALDPATLIANARGRGELEGLVSQILHEAYKAKNVILFFDNAELFFSDETGAVDLRNVLLPVLEGGGIRLILSMDEQQYLKIGRQAPTLAQQLNRISVEPLGEDDTLLVCEDRLLELEVRYRVRYMYQSLKAAYRLGKRYVNNGAMPGQAVGILEAAAQFAQNGLVGEASVENAVEKMFGVRVANARGAEERTTLLNLEQLLHERMINQTRAVSVVASALRRARSGVRNQNRPIGTFLFLGPTGVGKTELAKALAAVYFGGEDRLVRLDLNEFSSADDVNRLIADASTDSMSLTAQIAKQPFSMVLLDEIEKAHPNVLNTLLQLLDEGVLRDINNREVSFRDAIIIGTSNAGADIIRAYISEGKQLQDFEDEFVNKLIDSGQFKPEFLNRFDEITVFRPLTPDELLQVVDIMLVGVNKTLAQQQIQVEVAADAKRKLVEAGNDPRLGARPLRRVVQRTVENIVAKQLLEGTIARGQTLQVSLSEIEEALQR